MRGICINIYYSDMRKLLWQEVAGRATAVHVGCVQRSEAGGWSLHSHDFYEVFWVDSGKGVQVRADGEDALAGGMVGFVRPADVHGFRALASSEPFSLINVAFPGAAWVNISGRYDLATHPFFQNHPGPPPLLALTGTARSEVSGLFRDMLHLGRTAIARDALLLSLASRLATAGSEPGIGHAPAWIRGALLGADGDIQVLRGGASELARRAGCSTAHLSRMMKSCLGVTASEWLMTRRLNRAAQMLEATSLCVSEVAAEAGFENLSHFHRCFLRETNQTPLQFRKQRARTVL